MGREGSFLKGFVKQAEWLRKAKHVAGVSALAGLGAYTAGKVLQKSEDPEQRRLRILRKAKMLPYQART